MGRDTRVLLIGFGNMGQALVRGWLAHGRAAGSIGVVDTAAAARAAAEKLGIRASERLTPCSSLDLRTRMLLGSSRVTTCPVPLGPVQAARAYEDCLRRCVACRVGFSNAAVTMPSAARKPRPIACVETYPPMRSR